MAETAKVDGSETEREEATAGAGAEATQAADSGETQPVETTVERLKASVAKLERALAEANRESAGRRKRLGELEKADAERQAATLSETEKLEKRLREAEAKALAAEEKLRTRLLRDGVMEAAARLGVVDADAAFRLLEPEALEVDEAGRPVNADAALRELVKQKPYLVAAKAGGVSPTNPGRTGNGGGQAGRLTLEMIRQMSPDEILARRAEVDAVMASQK